MKINCPLCGLENEEGARFCSNCNALLVESKTPNAKENPYIKIEKGGNRNLLKKPFTKMHFFSKDWFFALWQGDRPLWEAWWVLGLAISLGYFLFLFIVQPLLQMPPIYYFLLRLVTIFLQIFFWISAWRCAPNVHNNVWFYLVRFLILLSILGFLSEFL